MSLGKRKKNTHEYAYTSQKRGDCVGAVEEAAHKESTDSYERRETQTAENKRMGTFTQKPNLKIEKKKTWKEGERVFLGFPMAI